VILRLAVKSLRNRKFTASLTALSIALSVMLLLGVERIRQESRESFASTVSGTDLIVGARSSPVHLLLFSVFRIGNATNNLRWESYQALARRPEVAWAIPLALGDSHRGYRVLGTTPAYFEHFRYSRGRALEFAQGARFEDAHDAVLGADVAQALGYRVGQSIVIAHGAGDVSFSLHEEQPFRVSGVLARTGTPVDRTVHVSLEAIEAIHLDWAGGAPMPGVAIPAEQARKFDLAPKNVTAALVGLRNRVAVFAVQRHVADYEAEPLLAVLPGVALDELWQVVGVGERALLGMSLLVAVVSLAGLVAVVLAGLNERRRELAVLRAVGAGPRHVLLLLAGEGLLVTLAGAIAGALASAVLVAAAGPWIQARFGIVLQFAAPTPSQWLLLGGVVGAGLLASLVPGWRAYRLSLADGLSPPT
jgi:putative ABC transport system permease protein